MTTVRQSTIRRCCCVLTLKYTFICVYWWTRQKIHNTLIVVDRYLRLMGNKTSPYSAQPRLESFYSPFVASIDLSRQGVVDSYSPLHIDIFNTVTLRHCICFRGLRIPIAAIEICMLSPRLTHYVNSPLIHLSTVGVVIMDAQVHGEQYKLTVNVPLSVNDVSSMPALNQTIWYLYDMCTFIYIFATLSIYIYVSVCLSVCIYVDSLLLHG